MILRRKPVPEVVTVPTTGLPILDQVLRDLGDPALIFQEEK